MPPKNLLRSLVLVSALLSIRVAAVTRLASADGQFWDIQDTSPWAQDSGGIATGGRANPFNGFGYLKIRVRAGGPPLERARPESIPARLRARTRRRRALRLDHAGGHGRRRRFARNFRAEGHELSSLSRQLHQHDAGRARDRRRLGRRVRCVFEMAGQVTVAATSSGDRRIDPTDTFVTVMQNARERARSCAGPSGHGPSAHVLGSHAAGAIDGDRRHVRESVHRQIAWLRSGAHRLRVHVSGLRPARRSR